MNLLLHAHLANAGAGKHVPLAVADALAGDAVEPFDGVLANQPLGKQSSAVLRREAGPRDTLVRLARGTRKHRQTYPGPSMTGWARMKSSSTSTPIPGRSSGRTHPSPESS